MSSHGETEDDLQDDTEGNGRRLEAVKWAMTREGLTAPKTLLLVTLAWLACEGEVSRAQDAIGAFVGKDGRWVRAHLGVLEERGLVVRIRRAAPSGARRPDTLVLSIEA